MLQLKELAAFQAKKRQIQNLNEDTKHLRQAIEDLQSRNIETGLYNRAVLWSDLGRYLESVKRAEQRPYLLLLDIDDMKTLNRKAGHIAGDRFIAEVGGYLQRIPALGQYRAVADKFAVILSESEMVNVIDQARAIRRGISGLHIQQDIVSPRTVS